MSSTVEELSMVAHCDSGRRVARAAAVGPHGQRAGLCMGRGGLSEPRGGQRSCQERRLCCPSVATAGDVLRGLPPLVRTNSGRGLEWAAADSVSRAVGSTAARSDDAAARLLRQRAGRRAGCRRWSARTAGGAVTPHREQWPRPAVCRSPARARRTAGSLGCRPGLPPVAEWRRGCVPDVVHRLGFQA